MTSQVMHMAVANREIIITRVYSMVLSLLMIWFFLEVSLALRSPSHARIAGIVHVEMIDTCTVNAE